MVGKQRKPDGWGWYSVLDIATYITLRCFVYFSFFIYFLIGV